MKNSDGTNLICREAHKVCYTRREAGSILNDCRKHGFRSRGVGKKHRPRREYFCNHCGFYHLTHHPFGAEQHSESRLEFKFYSSFKGGFAL